MKSLQPRRQETSGKAIASIILSILGITCFWIFTGIPGIILGISAQKEIKESKGTKTGKGLAVAGTVVGCLSLILSCPVVYIASMAFTMGPLVTEGFNQGQTRAKVARAKSEMRNLAVALETYYIDNNSYPPTLIHLTTPVVHQTSIPMDPFAPGKLFDYDAEYLSCWVLRSVGPDGIENATIGKMLDAQCTMENDITWPNQPWHYDPTNGLISDGDVTRTGP